MIAWYIFLILNATPTDFFLLTNYTLILIYNLPTTESLELYSVFRDKQICQTCQKKMDYLGMIKV